MKLTLTFEAIADADGIVDGRILAQQFIAAAFQAVVPYVDGCPGCADKLFGALASGVIHQLHQQGELDGIVYRPGLGYDTDALDRHFTAARETTMAPLERAEFEHTHRLT